MNNEERHDRLVDVLLSELVGMETPPDVHDRVILAADQVPQAVRPHWMPGRRPSVAFPVRKSSGPKFALAAVVALLGVAGAIIQHQMISNARTPVLSKIAGSTSRTGGPLASGESISTGSDSRAVLVYQDGTRVELGPETTIQVAERSLWDRSKALALVAGKVVAEVSPQPKGKPMLISSSDAHARVVGTRLSFHIDADRTRLEVTEGAVHFIPKKVGREVLVEESYFAESGKSGFRHEKIPVPGIVKFTLMNADTDKPIRETPLVNHEVIVLSSLPTKKINIRADFEGDPPDNVKINIRRHHDNPTGLPADAYNPHEQPHFFVPGDHWADGRPEDCAAWTPPSGLYHLTAEAIYADAEKQALSKPLKVTFSVEP